MKETLNDNWPVWATEPIEIKTPDPAWIEQGIHEVQNIGKLLAPFGVIKIEHIGSTSIPNLPAKPIIDVMAKIQSFDHVDDIVDKLKMYNWNYVPAELDGQEWRRFFVKVRDDKRECHLHLMLEDEDRWEKQITFRDRLRKNPNLAKQYAELKKKLAKENKDDREAYTEAKTDFIKYVIGGK